MTETLPIFSFDLIEYPYLLMNIFLTALLAGLVLALLADSYIDRAHKRIILIILLLTFSLILQTILEYRISVGTPRPYLRTVVSIYGYCVRPVLIVLVSFVIADGRKTLLSWILAGINAAVYLTALFSPLAFQITENNAFHRGPLGYTCHLVTAMLLVNLVCLTIRKYGRVLWRDAAMVREELDALDLPLQAADPEKLVVRCFGWFDVFWHGEPLIFARSQTKELFAYLVDREGAACTAGEIASALWEDAETVKNPKAYLRVLTQDLRATLASVGMEDVLIRAHGQWAVRTEKLDCDYYRMKKGEPAALNAYNDEYMKQFPPLHL